MEENDTDNMSSSIEREEEEDGELPNIPYVPITRFRKRNCPSLTYTPPARRIRSRAKLIE